jgi:hypothetical protein
VCAEHSLDLESAFSADKDGGKPGPKRELPDRLQGDTSFDAVTIAFNGIPCVSVKLWCLLPDLLRSVGFGPVSSPPSGALQKDASISARDQSIWSAPFNSAKNRG